MDFGDAIVNGIPLVFVIAGLVQFAKKFNLKGEACTALSLGLGVVLGVAYQLQAGLPTDFAGWFGAIVYGLALGITTSGLYNVVKK